MKSTPVSRRPNSSEVQEPSGWRIFFFSVAVACLLGLSFRLYFSPVRLKGWINQNMHQQTWPFEIRFKGAELRLSRGSIPQFAVVLTGVQAAPTFECLADAPLKISELRLPFRLMSFFEGRVSLSSVAADDLSIDLDGIKNCGRAVAEDEPSASVSLEHEKKKKATEVSVSSSLPSSNPVAEVHATLVQPWWTPVQMQAVRGLLEGIEFSRVELLFENKTKKVYLESFDLRANEDEDSVSLAVDLRVPKEVTYGEEVPPLSIEATVKADSAAVEVSAHLSEGTLKGFATLRPAPGRTLEIDSRVAVQDVPLSTLVPLLRKSKITSADFKPRFLWLDCQATIHGPFQGLFKVSPVRLENCGLKGVGAKGSGGKIVLASAVRQPGGVWDSFSAKFVNVDMHRLLETFSLKGPDGVADHFGQLSGTLDVRSARDAAFKGVLEGALVRFSNRSVRALQKVLALGIQIRFQGPQIVGEVEQVRLENGEFDGKVNFVVDSDRQRSEIRADIRRLKLDERVQSVMSGGQIGHLSGQGEMKLEAGQLKTVRGEIQLESLVGREFSISGVRAQTELKGRDFLVALKAKELGVHPTSALFRSLRPLFFEHDFGPVDWILVHEPSVKMKVFDSGEREWEKAQGWMENERIHLTSAGVYSRERRLSGWVHVDYPAAKNLKWILSGTMDAPIFTDESRALTELRRRDVVDDATLGLPIVKSEGAELEESLSSKTTRGLRELGTKVFQRAKAIVPAKRSLKPESPEAEAGAE